MRRNWYKQNLINNILDFVSAKEYPCEYVYTGNILFIKYYTENLNGHYCVPNDVHIEKFRNKIIASKHCFNADFKVLDLPDNLAILARRVLL